MIEQYLEQLEIAVDEYDKALSHAAHAEADYKKAYYECLVRLEASGRKMTADTRAANAANCSVDELRAWRLAEASCKVQREVLNTLRTKVDVWRTQQANARETHNKL